MMDRLKACDKCLLVSGSLLLWEVAVARQTTSQYRGKVDFYLGTAADLEARSADGCKSCRSLLDSENPADLERNHGKVCGVSAHFRVKQPLLTIAWGNIDVNSVFAWGIGHLLDNENPTDRRNQFVSFKLGTLLSTNPILSRSIAGRGRPYDLDSYNVSLIRRWIERCDKHHESTCSVGSKRLLLPKAKLSLIDVEDMCIVTPDHHVRYAALSYVWGSAKVPQATMANKIMLRFPGAFLEGSSLELPATIRDAVRLCANIGIRYIWVDSLCIVQDDMESKMEQIKAMGSVYADAYLTLVALSSEAAGSGIPRVSQRKSSSDRSPFIHLPGQTLVQASPSSIGLMPMNQSGTTWAQRAWTLQEMVLSNRLLFLGPVATWGCSGAQWSEDFEDISEFEGQPAFTEKIDKPSIPSWPDMLQYSHLASVYAGRRLTMPGDAVNAFEGIMGPMRQFFPGEFLFGIPEFLFDIGLLWQHRRRGANSRSGLGWAESKHEFPSWTWISHRGSHLQNFWHADYLYPRPDLVISPLVKWEKQNMATGDWEAVENSYHVVRKHFESPETPTPDSWTKHTQESEPPYYQSSAFSHLEPSPKFSYPIPAHQHPTKISTVAYHPHLLFRGGLARVCFQYRGTVEQRDETNGKLLQNALVPELDIVNTEDGDWIGRIRLNLQPGSVLPKDDEEQEVIAISEAKISVTAAQDHSLTTEAKDRDEIRRGGDWYKFVNVLWIGRTKDDKVYRKALGRIWLVSWEKISVEQVTLLLT